MKLRDNIPENYKDLSTRPLPGNCDWLVDKVSWHFLANHKESSPRPLSRNCDWLVDKVPWYFSANHRELSTRPLPRNCGWLADITALHFLANENDLSTRPLPKNWLVDKVVWYFYTIYNVIETEAKPKTNKQKPHTFNKYVSAWASCSCVKGAISNLAGGGFVCAGGVITVIFAEFWKAKGDIRGAPAIAFGSCDGFWGVSYQVKTTRGLGTNPNIPYSKMAANKLFFCLHVN